MDKRSKKNLIGSNFEKFVLSVIEQICTRDNKTLYSGFGNQKEADTIPFVEKIFSAKNNFSLFDVNRRETNNDYFTFRYDAFAPQGFGEFHQPVIIEIKYNISNMKFTDLVDNKYENVISLYVINQKLTSKDRETRIKGKNVVVWDGNVIEKWRKEYSIDYYGYFSDDIPDEEEIDFELKIESNKKITQTGDRKQKSQYLSRSRGIV